MQQTPADTICDPAAGTGGFLCNAYQYVLNRNERDLDADEKRTLREGLVEGMELSPKVGRMCAMNLYLHGIGSESAVVIQTGHDSLAAPWKREYSMVLTNPPFGKKQSLLFVNEEGDTEKEEQIVVREDFWTATSNKQLNFVQHIYSLLKIDGRAAVVVPDNVLFEGGAGEKVRRNLLQKCRVHTLLRLPTGILSPPASRCWMATSLRSWPGRCRLTHSTGSVRCSPSMPMPSITAAPWSSRRSAPSRGATTTSVAF